jgi:ribose transport system permease protein
MNTQDLKQKLIKFQSIIALLIMCIVLSLLSDRFVSSDNIWNVMRQISVNMIISVGMTLVILIGGIDLSVGSVLALSGAITAVMLKYGNEFTGWNIYIGFTLMGALLGGTLTGAFLGWFNGLAITRFKVPPFVATLAMLTIARGLTMLLTGGF